VPVKPSSYKYSLILLLVVVSIAFFLIFTKPVKQLPLQQIPPLRVAVIQVQTEDMAPQISVTGYLRPARKANLHFELAGQLLGRFVKAGKQVTKGELLLQLEDGDYIDAVTEARAGLQEEQAAIERDRQLLAYLQDNRKLQQQEVARMQRLGKKSLASRSKYDETRQRLLQLQADEEKLRYSVVTAAARLQLRQVSLRRAQRNLARARLVAPFAGVVNAVAVQVGDYVSPSQAALELVSIDRLELYCEVDSQTAYALKLGQQVAVRINGVAQQGRIVAIQSDPDPATFTHQVRVSLAGEHLLPGQLGRAELPLQVIRDAVVIPVSAELRDEGRVSVFVVDGDRVRRVTVTLGRRQADRQVVTAGLSGGELIVARDVALLSDGAAVQYQPLNPGS